MGLPRLPLLLVLVLAAACSATSRSPEAPISQPPRAQTAAFTEATTRFGLDLYRKLRTTQSGNLGLAPGSLAMALSVAWAGARGPTAAEMARTLHFSTNPSELASAASRLMAWLNAPREAVRLRTTNGLFVQEGLDLEPAFAELTENQFAAPVEPVDFLGDPEQARQTINARVAEQTEERIPEILPARSVNSATRLVLSSAVYFLGSWVSPFMKEATAPMNFYVNGRTPRKVSMMHQRRTLYYGEVDDVLLLALPYKGWEISMLLILPTERAGLGKVEEALTPERLKSYSGRLTQRTVEVSLPRFEVNSSLELGATLRNLGMKLAFDASRADFSGITRTERLSISEAYHQVFVKVDEAGTEAAAATALTMSTKSGTQGASEFVADHPFLFAIRDTSSGALLFWGRVVAPAS